MKKYFLLQCKRVARFLPWGLCVVLVLFGCLSLVFHAMVVAQESQAAADATKIRVAAVGTAGDKYLQWGLAALQFDTTALSVQLVAMDEEQAIQAMQSGDIGAYIVFPEKFVDEALYGNVQKLRFVSTVGATGLVPIIKEEVTQIVNGILVACESGAYGVGDALNDTGNGELWGQHVNDLALEYVDFLFDRSKMYRVENLQVDGHIPFDKDILGGLTVMLLMLACLPFAPLYVQQDRSLARVLRARRLGALPQILAEFGGYFAGLSLLLAVVAWVLSRGSLLPEGVSGWTLLLRALPALFAIGSLSYLLYSLTGHLTSGVLLSFFVTLVLCFVGGCMYPVTIFPESVQTLAGVLPSGLARQSLTACFMGASPVGLWPLLGYGAGFLVIAMVIRGYLVGKVSW